MDTIDTHHHFVPPVYQDALGDSGQYLGGWKAPIWTSDTSTAIMSKLGIRTAILSASAPGVEIAPTKEAQRRLARDINTQGAELRDAQPDRFGFFASTPSLLDVEGAIAEITYALDDLHADGVILFTRYGKDPMYLGHEHFRPVWHELNKRRALVFVHPTSPADTRVVRKDLPFPVIDFPHESTRTAFDLILSGRKREFADVKILLSHAGGTLPWLTDRAAELVPRMPEAVRDRPVTQDEIEADAKTFYVDLALSTKKQIMDVTLDFFGPDHVLFGSDFPYAQTEGVESFTRKFHEYQFESDEVKRKVYSANAERLLPRLKRGGE